MAARQPGPYTSLGNYVKRARERVRLNQGELAKKAGMRQAQLSLLENGANVEIRFYQLAARALGFRSALEFFMSGGDEQTRTLLRRWRALPDDEARKNVLQLLRDLIVRDAE